jgi:hypothetical protein
MMWWDRPRLRLAAFFGFDRALPIAIRLMKSLSQPTVANP